MNDALRLYDAGYTDLVLIRPNEKAPAYSGWLHNRPSRAQLEGWTGNVGLIAQRFPGIDIDLGTNATLAAQIASEVRVVLGHAPIRTSTDKKPGSLLLPYRTEQPFRKIVLTLPDGLGAIEVLGEGRQYLVAGNHPDGGSYAWHGWPGLWEVKPTDLPPITIEQVMTLLESLREKYGGFIGRQGERKDALPDSELRAPDIERALAMVADLPNSDEWLRQGFPPQATPRDYWIAMGMVIKGATGDAGEQAFVDWTSRYEDGPVDLDDARVVYRGLYPERYGWSTLQRLHREGLKGDPTDMFDSEPAPEGYQPPPDNTGLPFAVHFSDEYITDRVLQLVRGKLAYVAGGWFLWNGTVWVRDETKESLRAEALLRRQLRDFVQEMYSRALAAPDEKQGEAAKRKAKSLMNRQGMRTLLDHLRAPLVKAADDFDADLMELNTPGGLVNLRNGEIRPTTPADLVTRQTVGSATGSYDPARAPNWEAFLDHLVDGDDDLRAFLQRFAGYCLTGKMNEKVFGYIWGSQHDTGKSTYIRAISHAMGSYAMTEQVDLFLGGFSKSRRESGIARLMGARLVTAAEPGAGREWDSETIKQITGDDRVMGRFLYKEEFEYAPTYKLLIAGNHQPSVGDADRALLRRILILPMNNQVAPEDMDGELDDKLSAEADAILDWMVAGCLEWRRRGLQPPEVVRIATDAYKDEEDVLAQWIADTCTLGRDFYISNVDAYRLWVGWCNQNGLRAGTHKAFTRQLVARGRDFGIERTRTNTERGWLGMKAGRVETPTIVEND